VMIAMLAHPPIVLVILLEQHFVALGAFDPQIVRRFPLGQERQGISDSGNPVHV